MENLSKYYLSLFLGCLTLISCDQLSKETYSHLDPNERRKLSAEYVALAGTYFETGAPEKMKLLEKAARINPMNELAWRALAEPYLLNGQYKEWGEYTDKAISLNPKAWQAWRGYDKLYYFRDYGGALYDLDATDTLTMDKTDYVFNNSVDYLRGLCYYGLNNHEKAKEYFEKYLTTEEAKTGSKQVDMTAYLYLGIIDNYYQDYTGAIEWLTKGIEPYKELADIHYQLAYAHFMMGDTEEAHKNIMEAKVLFEDEKYNRHRFGVYEKIEQLYVKDLETLEADIACFLD